MSLLLAHGLACEGLMITSKLVRRWLDLDRIEAINDVCSILNSIFILSMQPKTRHE